MRSCLGVRYSFFLLLITLAGPGGADGPSGGGAGGTPLGEPPGAQKFAPADMEKKLIELINRERQNHKLPPLRPVPLLFQAARAHATNMAKQGKMSHVLDGKDQFQRIKGTGYRYRFAAENVARGEVEMEEIVQGWMNSKGHRAAILNRQYTETGVGLARDSKDVLYYAQEFAVPRPRVEEEPDEPELKLTVEELKVLELTNAARKEKKLAPLKLNAQLTEAARKHSANMAKKRTLDHKLDGKNPADRLKEVGYKNLGVGENIYGGRKKGDEAAERAFASWMGSAGHRENILAREFKEIGIGTVRNDRGETYFTQVFAVPAKR